MKKIFSRVAHAFKHDAGAEQESAGEAAPPASPSPAAVEPGEHASLTSVDSGVLVDVHEPDRSAGGAGAAAGAEPVAPVTDPVPECAKPAAGDGADGAAPPEVGATPDDTSPQTAGGATQDGGEGQLPSPSAVSAASTAVQGEESPPGTEEQGQSPSESVQEQDTATGVSQEQLEPSAAIDEQELQAAAAQEAQETVEAVNEKWLMAGVEEPTAPTQEQDSATPVPQEPSQPTAVAQDQESASGAARTGQEPAAVERPSGDLQSGGGGAAEADSTGPGHPDRPGSAAEPAPQPEPLRREHAEADSVNSGQSGRHAPDAGSVTVESAQVGGVGEAGDAVAADGPCAMEAECGSGVTEGPTVTPETAATGGTSVTDSDGVLLETGTEDTADDLDGKPKEKKKKRKKKKKNNPEEPTSVSLVAEAVVKEADERELKPASAEQATEKASDSVKKAAAQPSDQTVSDDSAHSKTNKTNTKVSSRLTAGTKASAAKAKKSLASQAAKKLLDSAANRNGPAKAKSTLAKQPTAEGSGSRSSTPTRPLQNPAKSRLKTQLCKEASIESNASASSVGSSTARSTRTGKRSGAAGADRGRGAAASPVDRRDSLPLSVSSGSTTVSTRGEDSSARKARAKSAKQQVDKSEPAARSSTPTAKKKSNAVPATKTVPEKKASVAGQTGATKKEKKTKISLAKDKGSGTKKIAAKKEADDLKAKQSTTSPPRVPETADSASSEVSAATGNSGETANVKAAEVVGQPVSNSPESSQLPDSDKTNANAASARLQGSEAIENAPKPVVAEDASTTRPKLTQSDTIQDSTDRPPLTQHDTIQDSTERPPLTQHDTIQESTDRPPLTQHDTIQDSTERPPLTEQETLEDTSVLRPPLVQHPTIEDCPERPPLTQQETVDVPAPTPAPADPTVAAESSTTSDSPAVTSPPAEQPASPAVEEAAVKEAALPQVTLSPSKTAIPTSPSTSAVPTSPSAAVSDVSSRRSSMDLLDGPPRLRRSISGHGEAAGTPRPDAVLEVMSQVHADSEARLAARRQARAEAREIRMRELERQQREAEQNGEKLDDFSDVSPRPALSVASARAPRGPSAASSGRRASEDSAEDGTSTPSGSFHLRDVRHELRELEEKLRKTMVTSAQLDNDKSTLSYQVELLKDKLEEMQESHTQLQREHRTRCSEHEQLKRVSNRLKEDYECCKKLLEERDKLIAENGLVLVGDEEDSESESSPDTQRPQKALVSQNAAQLLEKAGGGTLDSRLRRLGEEKNELEDQLRRLKLELEEERHMSARARISGSGGGAESDQVQREVARQVGEYRFKLQKADQDITNLQTAVQRLENQVARYKAAAETAEKAEEELKGEKRKLQRELREAQQQVDELDSAKKTMERQQRLRRL
ncbi:flocculation protein FLO11-like isoform X2 [Amphibalanus amphitrite]|uniref:flocculation protein FLO11-like isoform X2 n=1 Tax=Amphibalanus amphitrite TaxID=1232801 RepID=UPI001C8FF152|nr:flocculation protein FLO11-like isoform X2 [Amphibalanus amphitrite]XP_043242109.1 flocculation protein FLO11-like isoform X2 [Amphibalanus amphitrite]